MKKRLSRKKKRILLIAIAVVVAAVVISGLGISLKDFLIGEIIFIIVALGIITFVIIWNLPINKGKRGEKRVARILQRIADTRGGYVINDVIIPGANNSTSQVDHILFTRSGIFVVETKNYAGRLYGTSSQHNWTQVLAYGKTKNTLYNPLLQNQTHIYNLKKIIGKQLECFSYVVILRANLDYLDAKYDVYTPRELKKGLTEETLEKKYSQQDIKDAYNAVNEYKLNPIATSKEHVQNIKTQQKNIENNICPRCGGNLVLRRSKNGSEFYGCSNYPNCKFTKKA